MFLKKTVPFLLTLGVGIFAFLYYFIPHKQMQVIWDGASNWGTIIGAGGMAVGIISMVRTYYKRAMTKGDPNRFYNAVALFCVVAMATIGFITGIGTETLFNDIFVNILSPLESTMFSLLAFYMGSAAFRSFRLKSFSAGVLLFTAILIMVAQIPLGEVISPAIPKIKDWLLDYPNVSAQRAILIGVSIGSVATTIKILLGIDKSVFAGAGK